MSLDHLITLDADQVDDLITKEMQFMIESFGRDIVNRRNGDTNSLGVFDSDPTEDIIYMQEHIEAFRLVLDWYGVVE